MNPQPTSFEWPAWIAFLVGVTVGAIVAGGLLA